MGGTKLLRHTHSKACSAESSPYHDLKSGHARGDQRSCSALASRQGEGGGRRSVKRNVKKLSPQRSTDQKLVPEILLNINKPSLCHRYGPCTPLGGTGGEPPLGESSSSSPMAEIKMSLQHFIPPILGRAATSSLISWLLQSKK